MPFSEELLALLRVTPEPTVLISGSGHVLFANAAARDVLCLEDEQPREQPFAGLTRTAPEDMKAYLRICARSTEFTAGAFSVERRSSSPSDYLCKCGLIIPKSGDSPSVMVLRFWPKEDSNPFLLLNQKINELTLEIGRRREAEHALRQSEAALRDRAFEAEAASRTKDEFLATLSHELRTPLNAVLGWTVMLRNGQLAEDRRERALATVERNARAQLQLIEELLDISRIITGKLRLNVQQLDPIQVVEAALESVRPAADARGIRLQPVLDPSAGPIMGDPDRLQQVIWNLLSNAVKFTQKGGRVQIILERIESYIDISVIDTGQGIRADFLPHVFERFRQQEATLNRNHGGLGLGLAIAKNLTELHGGSVQVRSAGEGEGSTFVIRLPRSLVRTESGARPFTPVVLPPRGAPGCPPQIEGLRVVVVDDEPDALELLVVVLEQCGAKVQAMRTASEAFESVRNTLPDLLISDIGMPGEDGYSLIRKIRSLPGAGGRTAAIALTAFARTEDRTMALVSGFQSHIPKPVEPAELLAVIASVVGRFSMPEP